MVVIREMKPADVEEVCAIENATFSLPWSRESFDDVCDKEDKLYLVCEDDGHIAGYCGAWISFDEADITNVAVGKIYRRKGYGRQLIHNLELELAKKGVKSMFLEVRVSNEAARNLYNEMGFKQLGIRKKFYQHPVEDGVVMAKQEVRI